MRPCFPTCMLPTGPPSRNAQLYPSFGDYYTLDLAANKLAVYTRPAGDARAAMGIHAMAVVGYSHARKEWLIKNSCEPPALPAAER